MKTGPWVIVTIRSKDLTGVGKGQGMKYQSGPKFGREMNLYLNYGVRYANR